MTQNIKNWQKYKNLTLRPDPFYQSLWLDKFSNKFMRHGKKSKVEKSVVLAFSKFKHLEKFVPPIRLFFSYLLLHRPLLGFIKVRKSRQFKQVPLPLSPRRQLVTVLKWSVEALKKYGKGSLGEKIYQELIAIKRKRKTALFKYKEFTELNFQITKNRVNSRFRWK